MQELYKQILVNQALSKEWNDQNKDDYTKLYHGKLFLYFEPERSLKIIIWFDYITSILLITSVRTLYAYKTRKDPKSILTYSIVRRVTLVI